MNGPTPAGGLRPAGGEAWWFDRLQEENRELKESNKELIDRIRKVRAERREESHG